MSLAPFRHLCLLLLAGAIPAAAQFEGPPLGDGPWVMDTYEQDYIRVSLLARGMENPFGIAFLPGTAGEGNPLGDILIGERYTGNLRLFRDGQLVEEPVMNLQDVLPMQQLFQFALHPRFAENGLLYFVWIKTAPHPDGGDDYWSTTAVARGRWNGEALVDLEEVFEAADGWSGDIGGATASLEFLPDETLLVGVSHRLDLEAPQSAANHVGKVLRIDDEGGAPADNPFYAVEGAVPEVWTMGNRSVMDFAIHPETGEVWELENGPQGGDEVNILRPGANYGWPLATFGRDYDGTLFNPQPWVEGTERPELFWVPSITVAGMTFYTGERFPNWKNNLFVTSMIEGRVPGTGHLERVVFNEFGEIRREELLNSLEQRIRAVVQGPDGLLYLLTDHSDGALLRIEPLNLDVSEANAEEKVLIAESDCRSCHRSEGALVGPAWRDIAARYSLNAGNVAMLAERIIRGGAGSWGEVPMTPHPDLSPEAARDMAERILGLGAE